MNKKVYCLLMAIPLLTGCASFAGFAKESYDGRTIDKNEEAISAYQARQEIIGEEKEAMAPTIPDFFFQEPLEFEGEELLMRILSDPIVIGKDVPEGRYIIIRNFESGYLTVADSSGEVVYQQVLDFSSGNIELNLYDGIQISANSETDPLLLLANHPADSFHEYTIVGGPEQPPLEEGAYEFTNGIFHVGADIKAGAYSVSLPMPSGGSGVKYFYLLNEDKSYQIIEVVSSYFNEEEGASLVVELEDSQILYIKDFSSIVFSPVTE